MTEIDIEAEIKRKEAELVEMEVVYKELMNQKIYAGTVIMRTKAVLTGLKALRDMEAAE